MLIDDSIVRKYLDGQKAESYSNCWIYSAMDGANKFEVPHPSCREWVSQLCDKLKDQIKNYIPRNYQFVKSLFPDFDDVVNSYTVMLVVGFPNPYDAMVLEHDHTSIMVFDLIQFGQVSLDENYSCHRVLTHELIHMCLHNKYPRPDCLEYADCLNYIAFDEGFAHALSYPDNIQTFRFDDFLQEKYELARAQLKQAWDETDCEKQIAYSISADTGNYWDKFASISGKLFLLNHLDKIHEIYQTGWHDFAKKIVNL